MTAHARRARLVTAPRTVAVQAIDPVRLESVIGAARMDQFEAVARAARELLGPRAVLNVNSTGAGGGVAEMLQTAMAYIRGVGIDARWLLIDGDPEFFRITKRVHNHLYGSPGDGGALGPTEHAHYEAVLRDNGARLESVMRPDDVVILHDPQTAGLVDALRARGVKVVWRCHVGHDTGNEHTERGWAFLAEYLRDVDAFVFSRRAFAPAWVDPSRLHIVPPSIDPFSAKNCALDATQVHSLLGFAGFAGAPTPDPVPFVRRDGSPGCVEQSIDPFLNDPPPFDAPLVVQVSRWDPMKDMRGVMLGFVGHAPDDAHLLLVGPDVEGVADDGEAGGVLDDCVATWHRLAPDARARVHLGCIPMFDVDANALFTNAIQRHATVVTQKSVAEGFGLTIAEAMWKSRPVVASRVGGIPDQITHGVDGLLVDDPLDLASFGAMLTRLLTDHGLATQLGDRAHRHVVDDLLGDRHLERWGAVLQAVLAGEAYADAGPTGAEDR